MPINLLRKSLKHNRLTRNLYFGMRNGKVRVSDSIKIHKLARKFQDYDLLVVKDRNAGFFSMFLQALCVIRIARKNKQRVVFQFDQGPYFDPERQEKSWWSYYFEESNTAVWQSELDNASEQKVHEINSRNLLQWFSRLGSRFERRAAQQLASEFILKKEVTEAVQAFKQTHFGQGFVIGLHYRGTDKVQGRGIEAYRVDYHSIDEIINAISTLEIPFRLFVATDEEKFIQHLDTNDKIEIIYTDSLRSDHNWPVHLSEGQRSNYQLGIDALLDSVLLSQCDILLRTESNLSRASEFFNPTLESINLSREHTYARNDLTKRPEPNLDHIRNQVASAYRRKQAEIPGK